MTVQKRTAIRFQSGWRRDVELESRDTGQRRTSADDTDFLPSVEPIEGSFVCMLV